MLARAAEEAGAELREAFTVKEVVWEEGRAVGIRGRERGGAMVGERARVVVGADGLRSTVAREVGAEPYAGMHRVPNHFRRSAGPGWALLGDAGYHKDPAAAQGITDAFRDAEALAEAIDRGLGDPATLDGELAAYARHRDEVAMPWFRWALRVARLEALSPPARQLYETIRRRRGVVEPLLRAQRRDGESRYVPSAGPDGAAQGPMPIHGSELSRSDHLPRAATRPSARTPSTSRRHPLRRPTAASSPDPDASGPARRTASPSRRNRGTRRRAGASPTAGPGTPGGSGEDRSDRAASSPFGEKREPGVYLQVVDFRA